MSIHDADERGTEPVGSSADDVPNDNTTLVSVLDDFRTAGYGGNVGITRDGLVRCPACGTESPPECVTVHQERRMEGASDPADMLVVLGVECPACHALGAAVVHYGPTASAEETDVLRSVGDSAQPMPPHESGPDQPAQT